MVAKQYPIKQLTDKERLQEIYQLRVSAWENSVHQAFVNRTLFSKGWFDDLDETGIHWIIEDEKETIIAAARINIVTTVQEIPSYSLLELPTEMPMAILSRLVVDAQYRCKGMGQRLKQARMDFCKSNSIPWVLVFVVAEQRANLIEKFGWTIVGQMDIQFHNRTKSISANAFLKKV